MGIHDEENFSPLGDPEEPDDSDKDQDIFDNTEPCPNCSRLIYELSDFCPHCGQYVTLQEGPMRKHWWIVLAVVACLIIVFLWLAQSA
jgi:hypothetical protein